MTTEILLVFAVLAVTIVLFVAEKLRIDVIALLVIVSVGMIYAFYLNG
jgi:hypothetical protein